MISIIAAIAKNNAIGKDNKLLWHISEDLKRFKKLTTGKVIVMGQKTFESLPIKPLPNRTSIVITDDRKFKHAEVINAYSINESLEKAKNKLLMKKYSLLVVEVFINNLWILPINYTLLKLI